MRLEKCGSKVGKCTHVPEHGSSETFVNDVLSFGLDNVGGIVRDEFLGRGIVGVARDILSQNQLTAVT